MKKPPHTRDRPKSIYRRPTGCCQWCGGGVNSGKLICEYCRQLDPDRAAHKEKDEEKQS